MDYDLIKKRIAGCLYGGALGDALGYAVEFSPWENIKAKYGVNGICAPELIDGKARVSDDTQMTLFTAEGMCFGYFRASQRGIGAEVEHYVYDSYLCWLQTQGYPADSLWNPVSRLLKNPDMNCKRAPGNTCLNALMSGKMGTIDNPINNSKGCGGVMRTAPLGCLRGQRVNCNPFGAPIKLGARVAAITHGHPLGFIPAGMLSDIVDRAVFEDYATITDLINDSIAATEKEYAAYCRTKDLTDLLHRAAALADANGDCAADVHEQAIRSLGGGWVGEEALAIAIYAVMCYPTDLKKALITAVNHGGDSDSTGAIAGNILGAYLGFGAVPADWVPQLELTDEIDTIIDMLINANKDA